MRVLGSSVVLVAFAAAAIGLSSAGEADAGCPTGPVDLGPVAGFVANCGQWSDDVAFAASSGDEWMLVTADGLRSGRGDAHLALRAVHARALRAEGHAPTGAICNFLCGAEEDHVRGVPVFRRVRKTLWPGVTLVARPAIGSQGAAFAYDLDLDAAADVRAVAFDVEGCDAIRVDARTGELVVTTALGELRQSAPLATRLLAGERQPIACRFELRGGRRFGFSIEAAPDDVVCIDPDLQWASTVGGARRDNGFAAAVADNGDAFVVGTTLSTDMPTTSGVPQPVYGGAITTPSEIGDGFVARFAAADGSLLWCTYLGGAANERLLVAASIGDEVVVGGWSTSADYPTTLGAYDTSYNGAVDGVSFAGGDVVVTRLAADGQSLVYSTFLGGSHLEYASSMGVSPTGEVAVSGHVHSPNFPVTATAYQPVMTGSNDMYVTVLSADGSALVGSTYFGDLGGEQYGFALSFTADGSLVVAGATDSDTLPTTPGAYDTTFNGGSEHFADGFAIKMDATLSSLLWSTYLGTPSNEYPRGMALHADGSMTFTGTIDGPGLPTTAGVFGATPFGGRDGFAWRLSADGSTTIWCSYFGGSDDDQFERCVGLGGGRVAVAGQTRSTDLALTVGSVGTSVASSDGLLAILASDGSDFDYATVIGGNNGDFGTDVQRTPSGGLFTTGTFYGGGFPMTAASASYQGGGDAYAVQVAALPDGLTRHGEPSGSCGRDAKIYGHSAPTIGNGQFALTAGDVPTFSPAVVAVSTATSPVALPVLGFDLWVDAGQMVGTPGVLVDAHGTARLPLPLPASPSLVGASLAAQFVWLDACPALSFGASDAVELIVQA